MERLSTRLLAVLVAVLLVGLPLAVWLDLRVISANALTREATGLDSVITNIRGFYANDIVARIEAAHGHAEVTRFFMDHPGGIPIPATFSLELGKMIKDPDASLRYRFVSEFPFKGRPPHKLDAFERDAIASFARHRQPSLENVSWSGMTTTVRYATPIIMGPTCVACHNSNPDSPKHDWKVGDVRGIQELIITQPLVANIFSFRYLLAYFIFASLLGLLAIWLQRRHARTIAATNRDLETANDSLLDVSQKISRYISPQIFEAIFSGKASTDVATQRKKLTIFFSDIKDFTATTERMQAEELTALLNEYFSEMSQIALDYGGTLDKFIGDAILVFFGDPESRGTNEDAAACVRMAIAMQHRLAELGRTWRKRGIEHPFRARMGINTGYCNVGNFGSRERIDYTIIGAEANLAARLQSIAEPGSLVVSYETYALVSEIVHAHALEPITMRGIARPVIPYVVDGLRDEDADEIIMAHGSGFDVFIDAHAVTDPQAARAALENALSALDESSKDT